MHVLSDCLLHALYGAFFVDCVDDIKLSAVLFHERPLDVDLILLGTHGICP